MPIKAPYNFVPLSKKVVRPEWSSLISHDMPFADAQCGTLILTITAAQPIFTRNSVPRTMWEDAVNKKLNEQKLRHSNPVHKGRIDDIKSEVTKELGQHFSKDSQKGFFLPGSSIKGSIRSVLEIMSFGDLGRGVNKERYGMRDLQHEDYKALFAANADHQVQCGWLYESNGTFYLNDCGEPVKVPQTWIDTHFDTQHFRNFAEGRMRIDDEYKAARKKYDFFAQQERGLDNVEYGGKVGTLVFTGQPSPNTKTRAKTNEFLFSSSTEVLDVAPAVVNNFKIAYYDSDVNAQKPDYKHRSKELRSGKRIPVFFHKDDNGNVISLGLAYMYKIPFTHSIREAVQRHQKDSGFGSDLAECIFGHVDKNNALKGRVTFGHAFANGSPQPKAKESEVLNSPKPTYYPTYIRQEIDGEGIITTSWKDLHPQQKLDDRRKEQALSYQTLFYDKAVPSGWKRYPVHSGTPKNNKAPNGNTKLETAFCPLPAETAFTCTVNYHNLKKVELGALLSVLSFHNTPNCFHTFGMAKPLGYGKCTVKVDGIPDPLKQECLADYEAYMEQELEEKWLNSPQLKELIAMSQTQRNGSRSELKYMTLNEHRDVKTNKEALDAYTKLLSSNSVPAVYKSPLSSQTGIQERLENDNRESKTSTHSLIALFEAKKAALTEDLKKRRDSIRLQEEVKKQTATLPRPEEVQAGASIEAIITTINGYDIQVQLMLQSDDPIFATITSSSLKKAAKSTGSAISLKTGQKINVKIMEHVKAGEEIKVSFVSK